MKLIILMVLAFMLVGCGVPLMRDNKWAHVCELKGGIVIIFDGYWKCIKPDAFIIITEEEMEKLKI